MISVSMPVCSRSELLRQLVPQVTLTRDNIGPLLAPHISALVIGNTTW
jgi:hypothetical protein